MRISYWSSDVCSSDLISRQSFGLLWLNPPYGDLSKDVNGNIGYQGQGRARLEKLFYQRALPLLQYGGVLIFIVPSYVLDAELVGWLTRHRSEEHTSELQSLMRTSYAAFCLKKKKKHNHTTTDTPYTCVITHYATHHYLRLP